MLFFCDLHILILVQVCVLICFYLNIWQTDSDLFQKCFELCVKYAFIAEVFYDHL